MKTFLRVPFSLEYGHIVQEMDINIREKRVVHILFTILFQKLNLHNMVLSFS